MNFMNFNDYGEITNGEQTYESIANLLLKGETVGIGWTDEIGTHLDIIFKLGLDTKCGNFQRGIKANYLYISIIDYTSYAFCVENGVKQGTYIQEKLRINDYTGDKLAQLINGIIICLNKEN